MLNTTVSLKTFVANKMFAANKVSSNEDGDKLIEKFVKKKTRKLFKSKKISDAKAKFQSSLLSTKMILRCLMQNS